MKLKIGDQAPDFEAVAENGSKFVLADLIGKTNIVLYFYPKDFTLGCTKEACSFRDVWERAKALGATVVGVSSDSEETHTRFKREHNLQFTLVSDHDKSVRKLYGAIGSLIPPRITFIIDKSGKIRSIFNSQINITKHIEEALKTLEGISRGES